MMVKPQKAKQFPFWLEVGKGISDARKGETSGSPDSLKD